MSFSKIQFKDGSLSKCRSTNPLSSSKISFQSLSKFYMTPFNNRSNQKSRWTHSSVGKPDEVVPDEDVREGSQQFITAWRRAIIDDKPAIKKLRTLTGSIANELFRNKKIDELIEQSYFTIVQLNSKGEPVSFTAYNPYPNISSVSLFWTDWLKTHYRIKDISERNVLFIHYMVWEPQREREFLPLLLETSFTEFIHLKHIILVKPPKAQIPNFYEQYFIPVLPLGLEEYEYDSVQSLLVCLRTTIIQPFPIRTAFEEELDSISDILSSSKILKNQNHTAEFKDELGLTKGEHKKILVCENNCALIGVMVLNFTVDLDSLNKDYELVPFNGLKRVHSRKHNCETPPMAALQRNSSTKNKDPASFLKSSDFLFNKMNWEVSIKEIPVIDSDPPSPGSWSSFSFDSDFMQFSSYNSGSNTDTSETDFDLLESISQPQFEDMSKADIRVTYHSSLSRASHFFTPISDGLPNCFVIDFFAVDIQEIFEKLISLDFLKAAFRVAHDKDYCLLTVPSDFLPNSLQEFFVRVPSKLMSPTKLELYICSKHALYDTPIFVKPAELDDLDGINTYLKNIDDGDAVYEDIVKAFFNGDNFLKSYLLLAENRIVGVSLIDCQDHQDIFHNYFDIARHIPELNISENQSLLKHLIINPTYSCHARFFTRQIMKFSNLTCLYYAQSVTNKGCSSLVTVVGQFIPIKPRNKILCDKDYLMADKRYGCSLPFSLYFLTEKSCDFNKIHLNIVIVVVGASRTALSFLEDLIFGSTNTHVHYNNLICVTPHVLETRHNGSQGSEITEQMFPVRDDCSRNYIFMLSLKTYVSFVYGVMTAINRSEKYITINDKIIIKYDYLVLTCGVQYLTPVPKPKELSKNACQRRYVGSLARFLINSKKKKVRSHKHPSNLFIINTSWDAKYSLKVLQSLIHKAKKTEKKIIVYGHNLHVYLTINTLMKLGIPGEAIAFVEPILLDEGKVTVFNDYSVDQAVLKSLENNKINYYTRYFFYDWTVNTEDDRITSVIFHSKTSKLVIPCLAFFPFEERLVSEVTFRACYEAGLVYDGRLVIDHNFRTNDQYIYAAGTFTKYARRYFASDQNHEHFSSIEVGRKLARIIRSKVDPFLADVTKKESALVPQLKEPVMYYCQLPGGFNFFVLRKPGRELDLETAYNLKSYGEVLFTGNCQMKHGLGYFRLHLSPEGFVESITCYTKGKIDFMNLSYLYGLHEKLLNNLLCRYDLALIPDFFDYFRQPWASALFHENFRKLRAINTEVLRKKLPDGKSFIDKVVEDLESNKWQSLPNGEWKLLERLYEEASIKQEIQNNLFEFLDYFTVDLPMYAPRKAVTFYKTETH